MVPDCCLSPALAFPSDLGARRPCRGLRGWGCAHCQSLPRGELFPRERKRPRLHSQAGASPPTKRRTEGIRVPVPLAWGGSSTARVLLRLCPESACQLQGRPGLAGAFWAQTEQHSGCGAASPSQGVAPFVPRSEEHTSESVTNGATLWLGEAAPQPECCSVCAQKAPASPGLPWSCPAV